jgi:hypothetical protein
MGFGGGRDQELERYRPSRKFARDLKRFELARIFGADVEALLSEL